MTVTFGQARESYEHQADLRSAHTLNAYLRAIDLFLLYLNDRKFEKTLPVRTHLPATAEELLLSKLSAGDEGILEYFAVWMQTPGGDKRPYALATVELRLAGVQRWFEFMAAKNWLPEDFSLAGAIARVRQQIDPESQKAKDSKAVELIHDLTTLVDFYATQKPPASISKNADRLHRWELSRLRNHALLQTLAETGGQISAILSLSVADVSSFARPLNIDIRGKSNHTYQITLDSSIPAIKQYLQLRAVPADKARKSPLFVSHDSHYEGKRMSRIIAWRIIQRAAHAVGLPRISPHDIRHWRAQQLIKERHSLEEVRRRLGHRSIHTVRTYYGHLLDDSTE